MTHARREFHALHENLLNEIAIEAAKLFGMLYGIEQEAQEPDATPQGLSNCMCARHAPSRSVATTGSSRAHPERIVAPPSS